MPNTHVCDLAIVGGGLSGALVALALAQRRPDLGVRLIEAGDKIGGNHLWSFFGSDVAAADRWLVAPLVAHRWPGYEVAFPAHRRCIAQPYYSIESARLDTHVRRTIPAGAIMLGRQAVDVSATAVVLDDGDRIEAKGVIDARGTGDLSLLDLGWQKFVGRELRLSAPHGQAMPIVMDATVPQLDGYRFVYCLPFSDTRMFVEDTYYSDTPDLDAKALGKRIKAYAASRGWEVAKAGRRETGVLPVVIGGDFDAYWRSGGDGVAKAGMRAGLFHPTTGYSLPDAVRLALLIADAADQSGTGLHDLTHDYAKAQWNARGFYRMLDTMLFKAAEPQERYRILERFYRLNPALIGRFYAGQSTMFDKARILAGKPPVPIGRAIAAIRGQA
ncbi:MAG: lycopene beta-cyclase CrtY [Pseudomonadota bacterium]|nr:lycopene beta-cyclase CrtY [Pseudomonadota bacterium]